MTWIIIAYIYLTSLFVILYPFDILLARYIAKKKIKNYPEASSFTIIIPLAPNEHHLIENTESYFSQRFNGVYEFIFVAEEPKNNSAKIVTQLINDHPHINARLIYSGKVKNTIAKMHNLACAVKENLNDIVVFLDSDVRLKNKKIIREITRPLHDSNIGIITAAQLYRPAKTVGGHLLSTMINADLWGYFAALFVLGKLNVANGAIIAIKRETLKKIGNLQDLDKQILSDTAIAKKIMLLGKKVFLSPHPAQIEPPPLKISDWWNQTIRWHIGMRLVLPIYEYILYGLLRANILFGITIFLLSADSKLSMTVLFIPISSRFFSFLLIQLFFIRSGNNAIELITALFTDLLSPFVWLLSWFKNTIMWRNRSYHLDKNGNLEQKLTNAQSSFL